MTLYHVFCALLPVLFAIDVDRIIEVAAVDFPPWDDGAVFLSPGGQTPSLKQALEHAILTAHHDERPVTPQDMWNSLPHGNADMVKHLLELFNLDGSGTG